VFVDFAGDTIDVVDRLTGEVQPMKLFVAAMGASNYTYAEACPSEGLADWIRAHVNLFAFLGGAPTFVVCDNLKAAVSNPDRYDPGLNRTYAEMASHYQPRRTVRRTRQAQARPAAGPALCFCTLEAMPCRSRLSCRDRRTLVFRALSFHPRAGRRAHR
jgi:transposase